LRKIFRSFVRRDFTATASQFPSRGSRCLVETVGS
jgi:hypothetical protein